MMKKYGHIILIAMATFIVAACCHDSDSDMEPVSGNDVPDNTNLTAISFSSLQVEEQTVSAGLKREKRNTRAAVTRADAPLSEEATQFKVWGYKNIGDDASYSAYQTVFPGYAVEWKENSANTTTTNSNGWDYFLTSRPDQTIKYWDWDAKAYRFAARTTSIEATEKISVNALTGVTELKITVPELYGDKVGDAPLFSKLWFSNGNLAEYPTRQFGKPVVLEFVKPFSHVRFMFISADPDVDIADMELSDIVFKPTDNSGIGISGSVTVTYPITGTSLHERFDSTPTNTITGFTQDYVDIYYTAEEATAYNTAHSLSPGDEGYKTTADIKTPGTWYTVLPVSSQGSFTLSLTVYGEPRTATVPAGYMTWKAGYQYTYIFKVSGDGGIEFGDLLTAFTGWSEGFTGSEAVYNW